jgi:uncharacterized protein (TIGR02588 family)
MRDQAEKADNSTTNEEDRPETRVNNQQQIWAGSDIPLFEWLMAIVGLILVVGSIGYLLYQAVKGDAMPPDISFEVTLISPISNGYLVNFRAMNQGDVTAKGLMVEGQLTDAGQEIETSETSLDYMPSHSEREGGLFFTQDPRQFELQLRAVGYEQP